jgi:hypothetical protein
LNRSESSHIHTRAHRWAPKIRRTASLGYDPRHVSPIDDKGEGAARGSALRPEAQDAQDRTGLECDRVSGVEPIGGAAVTDESERTRLIHEIMRLMREPSMPEATRHAGMTLVGWLARRRVDEPPHSIGVDEARESERRVRAARAKTRL